LQKLRSLLNIITRNKVRWRPRVLVIGDSHMRVFRHWVWTLLRPGWRFDVNYVPGATLGGIHNLGSASKAREIFNAALQTKKYTQIMVGLGEVDMGYALWIRARQKKMTADALLLELIDGYRLFLQQLAEFAPVTVIAAPYQTVVNWQGKDDDVGHLRVKAGVSLYERNMMTQRLNAGIADCCKVLALNFVDGDNALNADMAVKSWLVNPNAPYDHHYRRGRYALWLATKTLRPSKTR